MCTTSLIVAVGTTNLTVSSTSLIVTVCMTSLVITVCTTSVITVCATGLIVTVCTASPMACTTSFITMCTTSLIAVCTTSLIGVVCTTSLAIASYAASEILGSTGQEFDLLESRDVIRHVTVIIFAHPEEPTLEPNWMRPFKDAKLWNCMHAVRHEQGIAGQFCSVQSVVILYYVCSHLGMKRYNDNHCDC